MIRICHLITSLDVGGAEHALVRLCIALAARGYDQLVLNMTSDGRLAHELRCAGITTHSLGMGRGSPSPAGLVQVVRKLRRFRPHVLQTWMYHADLLGTVLLPFVPRVQLVWNVRCSNMSADQRRMTRWVIRSLALLSRIPDAIITNSSAGQADHCRAGYRQQRFVLIPNGVDTERFRPLPGERATLRANLGVPVEGPLIGLVARFHPMKDHATFLDAANRFLVSHPDAHFILAGLGCEPGAEPLEAMIRQRGLARHVLLLGPRCDLPRIYPALDLVCLSSAFGEGSPNVLLEALACGVPCVATDVGDNRVIIGECGQVVPPRDPAAMATAWQDVLERHLAVAARARAVTHYADSAASTAYDTLYGRLLKCDAERAFSSS
jgi:glycosyltransferase involved in cell wall biosynthesis